jgi:hypothetical protein
MQPAAAGAGGRVGLGVRRAGAGRHWNAVTLDGSLPDQHVRDMVEDSYDLVVSAMPARVREQLGWAPEREEPDPAEPVSQRSVTP